MRWMGCVLVGGLFACSFDAGSPGETDAGMIGGGDAAGTGSTAASNANGTVASATAATSAASTADPTGQPPTSTTSGVDDATGETAETTAETNPYGESTGEPEALASEGVVVRYFLDEASNGSTPTLALDSTDDPFGLPIDYAGAGLSYAEVDGNRGLQWSAVGLNAGARGPLAGSELDGLAGVTSLSFEVVFDIAEVMGEGSRILHVGAGDPPGQLSLSSPGAETLQFAWANLVVRRWTVPGLLNTRHVAHVVIDTDAPNAGDRIRLLLDGAEVVPELAMPLAQGETVKLDEASIFALGNRDQERSFRGTLFYAAVYAGALKDDAIAQNVAMLLASDDG